MTKVGEHIILDIIGTTKEYDPAVFEKNLPKAFELAEEVENISLQYITSLKLGKPKILSLKEMNKVLMKAKNYKRG